MFSSSINQDLIVINSNFNIHPIFVVVLALLNENYQLNLFFI